MKKPFGKLKLVQKLFGIYLAACLIPLAIVSVLLYHMTVRSLEEMAQEFSGNFSAQIVEDLDNFIREYDRLAQSVLVDNDILLESGEGEESILVRVERKLTLQKMVSRLKTIKPDIRVVMLITEKGELLYSYGNRGEEVNREALQEAEWFRNLKESTEITTVTAAHTCDYYDRNRDSIAITVGRKLLNARGAYAGLLLMDIDPAAVISLNDSFLTARNKYEIQICVTNDRDEVLYDSDIAGGRVSWSERAGQNILPEKQEDYIILTDYTENSGLRVYTIIPKNSLMFQINHITGVMKLTMAASVILVLILSVVLSRVITRPLARLRGKMQEMENGQYHMLEIKGREDEIGELVASYNHMAATIKRLIEQVYLAEIEQGNARFLALQTQINPHMLFNTLEAIRMTALTGGDEKVAEMIKLLARMFRAALYDTPSSHRVRDEIEYARSYIRLQNLKFRDCFSLKVEVPETLLDAGMISLVFQPVIENCIEHGHRAGDSPMCIRLSGKAGENRIFFRIEDDGMGMEPDRRERLEQDLENIRLRLQKRQVQETESGLGRSLGLRNIAERILLHYGSEYYLKLLWSDERGTCIEICIPAGK